MRLLETLEKLLELPATDLATALTQACDVLAAELHADKIDAFLYDESRASLVALGSSRQPLSEREKELGLDVLSVANGGRIVDVYRTGEPFATGRLDLDADDVTGIAEELGVRSTIAVALDAGGARRGVLVIAATAPDFFTAEDVRYTSTVARLVGMVAHRAELVEAIAKSAIERGRRAVADELVTVLAHDLRNYLAPLEFRVGMLRKRAAHDPDKRDADLALRALRRIAALIDDMLDVARIDRGVFTCEAKPLAIGELAREIATTFGTSEHPVDVTVEREPDVVADPARVRQCLMNVVSNAVEHSPKGEPVKVVVSCERRDAGDLARVDVVDTGPGVPAEMLPRIFDRFVSGGGHGGLGLGLYLAKRIAVMHQGDLTVESTAGRGTRFTLILPCALTRDATSDARPDR